MNLPLRATLVPMLQAAFPKAPMQVDALRGPIAVFRAKHPSIGDLVIEDEGDEVTVILGNITHRHFGSQDSGAPAEVQARDIASEVTEYLRQLFADEIEFFGTGGSGGARARSNTKRGRLSKLLFGRKSYVWSGPLPE
jgi:hypothetical protein